MAEQSQTSKQQQPTTVTIKRMGPARTISEFQVLAVVTLLPIGGTLLLLSRLTLGGTLIRLAVATPFLVIFSPVLVPAALVIGLAITGFLTSGAFGVIAFSSLSWMVNYTRRSRVADQMEKSKEESPGEGGDQGDRPDDPD